MKQHYDVLLFDLDDTIFDFQTAEKAAFTQVFKEYGLRAPDYLHDYQSVSNGLWQQLEQQQISLTQLGNERFHQLFKMHKLSLDAQQFNDTYLRFLGEQPFLIEGAVALFEELQDIRIAAVSNGFERVQQARIALSPFANKFEELIISETVGHQKPSRAIFDYAFNALQINNKDTVLMIGDSLTSDIKGGQHYGIDTCWFNPNYKANHSEAAPTYEIHHLSELITILNGF